MSCRRAQTRCALLVCLLVTIYLPTYRCWSDTGQEARVALVSVAAEKTAKLLDSRVSHIRPVQACGPTPLQWQRLVSAPGSLAILDGEATEPPSCPL